MDEYSHLFGGSEDLQAVQLPDHDPAVYALGDMFETYCFFRYDDGWRYMPRAGATVDLQTLMGDEQWATLDDELGVTPGLVKRLLEEAKVKPWPTTA